MGAMVSPLRGADGNVEFLVHAVAPSPTGSGGTDLRSPLTDADLRATAEATEP